MMVRVYALKWRRGVTLQCTSTALLLCHGQTLGVSPSTTRQSGVLSQQTGWSKLHRTELILCTQLLKIQMGMPVKAMAVRLLQMQPSAHCSKLHGTLCSRELNQQAFCLSAGARQAWSH